MVKVTVPHEHIDEESSTGMMQSGGRAHVGSQA